jgi:hypothetical protein
MCGDFMHPRQTAAVPQGIEHGHKRVVLLVLFGVPMGIILRFRLRQVNGHGMRHSCFHLAQALHRASFVITRL